MRLLSHNADVLLTVYLRAPLSPLFGVSRRLHRRAWPKCGTVWLDIFAHFLWGRHREYSGEKRRLVCGRDAMLTNDIISQYLYVFSPRYLEISQAHGGIAPPESRLEMAKWGGPILTISMLFFGWTSYPSISLWVPVLAGFGVGMALIMLFLSLFNYIIDAYLMVAASALAASTVVRSAFGAGFPVSTSSVLSTPLLDLQGTAAVSRTSWFLHGHGACDEFTDIYFSRVVVREPDVREIGPSDRVDCPGSLHVAPCSSSFRVRKIRTYHSQAEQVRPFHITFMAPLPLPKEILLYKSPTRTHHCILAQQRT